MLKTYFEDEVWLISQPDHARVAGYLAAHWGNDLFTRLGHYTPSPEAEQWRAETILAIAQHDNGWWEWEADPDLDPGDNLPLDLSEMLQKSREQGMERWRRGIHRFAQKHPYTALLISFHPYWLYTSRADCAKNSVFAYPSIKTEGFADALFLEGDSLEAARRFITEIEAIQEKLIARLCQAPGGRAAMAPEILHPHVRLLQLFDVLSLALCSRLISPFFGEPQPLGDEALVFPGVPRESWEDRLNLELTRVGPRRILCQPYPFDRDPLPVRVPGRILPRPLKNSASFHSWWPTTQKKPIVFEYCSSALMDR